MTAENEPVTVEQLDIVRAPGFETGGFEIDGCCPGINLVHGPNGAGKTTTANSIMRVLWPDVVSNGEKLVGQLSLNGEQWRVDVSNTRAEYQRNGQEASAPNLPPVDQRDRYLLSLHDLLQRDTRNESFAETIERESAGGYDLSAAHDELGYGESPITRRKGVYQDAQDAVETWRDERTDAKGLEEERSRLTKLRSELEEAKQARDQKEVLAQAITYREAKSDHQDAKEELGEFPGVLEQVGGDELSQVEELDEQIDEWEIEKQESEAKQEDAEATLEATALPEDGVSEGVIARLKRRRDTLEEAESRKDEVEEALEGAKAERQSAREGIPLEIDHDALVDLQPGTWKDVSEFARTAEQVQAERQRRETIEQWADTEEPPEADLRSLERGSKALEEWLMAGQNVEVASGGEAAFRIGAVSAGVVSLAGVALGVLVNPLLFSVVLVGVALFVYGYRQQGDTETSGSGREPHRESFKQTGVESPASWTENEVRDRLVEIYDEIAEHKVVEERQQKRDALVAEQDIDSKQEALAAKREDLREEIGAAPETTDIELAVIVRRVLDWQEVNDEVVRLEAELDRVQENLEEGRETIQSELGEYGSDEVNDSATATERIRELERRQSDYETATRELTDAKETIEKATGKLTKLQDEQEEIFTTLDLDPGDRDALEALCEQVEEYGDAKSEVEQTAAIVEQEEEELETLPAFKPELKEEELPALKQELRQAKETAERYDSIQEQISGIEAKIKEAKSGSEVEEAITEKERALTALGEQLDDDYSAMVGDVLVEHIQEKTVEASRPSVFQRANELLATITHGRYELMLAEGEQTFRAYDTAKQKGFALEKLSSGTRVQVLLAVRLAFVEQQEQGAKLPILLDETLANTDDLRAEVIIESLIELAKEGRQIFYFTAQGDEVAKWRVALEETSDVEWTTIDLAEVQDLSESVQVPTVDSIESLTPSPAEPDADDHESYGDVLGVEPFNPYDGAGTAHLWYVVEDIEVLYDLLELGIERVGQLQNLLERDRSGFVPAEPKTLDEVQQNIAALEEFAQAWQIGRGDPVDRSVLEVADGVSDTYIERVSELAEELGGDAEQLVEALYSGDVDRFRRNKAEELEDYLQAHGYIVSREPLADDDIRIRMIERLVEAGVDRDDAAGRAAELLERVTEK
ncbi:ATP-binding protein [Natranaeroarchaeum sulfidigenes]|uniref:Chromosome segregation ATPase, Smc family n=1 Tax=Natranaeroarchaeum sulfidigenes TaxID=2784880 RepID=A0A897MS57_9EURY|nr:hypothetical protein [Natranaeroarchaeum sulfidigenes]QSG02868.1 Chromosome segregation ATPase, Smc family [Natranaeroarchaeum sulfidigenes]